MIFTLIVVLLALGWAVMILTALCPMRALRRRRSQRDDQFSDF